MGLINDHLGAPPLSRLGKAWNADLGDLRGEMSDALAEMMGRLDAKAMDRDALRKEFEGWVSAAMDDMQDRADAQLGAMQKEQQRWEQTALSLQKQLQQERSHSAAMLDNMLGQMKDLVSAVKNLQITVPDGAIHVKAEMTQRRETVRKKIRYDQFGRPEDIVEEREPEADHEKKEENANGRT